MHGCIDTITIEWDEATSAQWDELLSSVPYAAYQQGSGYGDVIREFGGIVHRGVIRGERGVVALAQVQTRRFFGVFTLALVLLGPVWIRDALSDEDKAAVYRAIKQTAPVRGLGTVLIMPPTADERVERQLGLKRVVSSYHTVILDLRRDEEALLAGLKGKWRNRLRAAQKADLTITRSGRKRENYLWLLQTEEKQRRRIGYRAFPTGFVPIFQELSGRDNVVVFEAKQGSERVAGVLFLVHGNTATYHIGWSSDDGKAVNAHNRLLWEGMLYLKGRGIQSLDLGGLSTDHGDGLARFKISTGGKILSQSGIWCLKPRLF